MPPHVINMLISTFDCSHRYAAPRSIPSKPLSPVSAAPNDERLSGRFEVARTTSLKKIGSQVSDHRIGVWRRSRPAGLV
jgi:hypothetical protein